MTAKNKVRGNILEKEIVDACIEVGLEAKRAWGSNGEAMGMHREVDVCVKLPSLEYDAGGSPIEFSVPFKIQAKRRRDLPSWLGFTEHVDAVVFRTDGTKKKYILLEFTDFLQRVRK